MGIKLLLADDSITIQKVIGIIFGGEEYSLTVVDNGKAAVEKARETLPDVLLIDALMPGMSGYEVCEAVRATPALATRPILLLTGSFEPFDEGKARSCGADDYIAKPFESQQIVAKVRELHTLGTSRGAAAAAPPAPPQPAAPPVAPVAPVAPAGPAPAEPAPAFIIEPEQFASPEMANSSPFDSPFQQQTAPDQQPADIWGAFIQTPEPAAMAEPPVSSISAAAAFSDPDVFAMVTEESDVRTLPSAPAEVSSPSGTGSQWVPVEEQTFEFREESIAVLPSGAFGEPVQPLEEATFGEISFEEEIPAAPVSIPEPVTPLAPAFEPPVSEAPVSKAPAFEAPAFEAPAFEAPAFETPAFEAQAPDAAPAPAAASLQPAAPAPAQLTEEQLKAALSAVSKDVIERIVWEVVPDLAETLIREAIRKIREGV